MGRRERLRFTDEFKAEVVGLARTNGKRFRGGQSRP